MKALAAGIGMVAVMLVLVTAYRLDSGAPLHVDRLGVASVESCNEHGPVSRHGYGITYTCQATVRWNDGDVDTRTLSSGVATPDDIGKRIPVFQSEVVEPRYSMTVGRHDGASFQAWPPSVTVVVTLSLLALLVVMILQLPKKSKSKRASHQSDADKWPVVKADRTGIKDPKIVWRWWLLAFWFLLMLALILLGSIPRYSNPRVLFGQPYELSWPQIAESHLYDPTPFPLTAVLVLVTLLMAAMAIRARHKAARVVKYGPAYIARNIGGDGDAQKRLHTKLDRIGAGRGAERTWALLVGAVYLGLGTWATLNFTANVPADAPTLVVLACARDAILLATLAGIWLLTRQPKQDRLRLLYDQYTRRHGASTHADTA